MAGFQTWKDKVLAALAVGVISGAVSWSGWMTVSLFDRPTEDDVIESIETRAPYVEERKRIDAELQRVREWEKQMLSTIDRNTDAINQLRVELARLQPIPEK